MPDIARSAPLMVNAQLMGAIQQMQVIQQQMRADNQLTQRNVEDLRRIIVNENAAMPHSAVLAFLLALVDHMKAT